MAAGAQAPGKARDGKGEGWAKLGRCLLGLGLPAWRSQSTNTPSRRLHTCLLEMSSPEEVRVTVSVCQRCRVRLPLQKDLWSLISQLSAENGARWRSALEMLLFKVSPTHVLMGNAASLGLERFQGRPQSSWTCVCVCVCVCARVCV